VQQQFMMRDPEKYKEQKEMEQQLLLQETAEEASVNSKIRALLHAFHMNRADPENSHLSSIYQMAKLRVCQNYDCKRFIHNTLIFKLYKIYLSQKNWGLINHLWLA
jgi:hypothetical protein